MATGGWRESPSLVSLMFHPHPSTNTQVIVNIFQIFANSKKTLKIKSGHKLSFPRKSSSGQRLKGDIWVLRSHWDALRRLNRKGPLSYRAREEVGGRGVSYGHLYFPYSHPVTPVIRTHFKPHSAYAQYTHPDSHPLLISITIHRILNPNLSLCANLWTIDSGFKFYAVYWCWWQWQCWWSNMKMNTMMSLMTRTTKMIKMITGLELLTSKVACSGCRLFANFHKTS